MAETDRSSRSTDEVQQRLTALQTDLRVVSTALKSEQQLTTELQEEIGDLNRLRSLDLERSARDGERIEHLEETVDHLTTKLDSAGADRDRELAGQRARHDAAIEEWGLRYRRTIRTHNREVGELVQELTSAQKEVESLRSQLNSAAAMVKPHDPILERMLQPDTVVVVDGDLFGRAVWPDLAVEVRRDVLLGSLGAFGEDRGVNFDVVFAETGGVREVERFNRLRVRVPHGYVPIETAIQGLVGAYRESGSVMVVSDRVEGLEAYEALSLDQFGHRLGLKVAPSPVALAAGTEPSKAWEAAVSQRRERFSPFDEFDRPAVTVNERP